MEDSDQQHEVACKNCSTAINGNYCHFCGQRYHDHKESFGELVYEFVADFLHFNSRFFRTVLPLLFAPGKLTISYNAGRQRSQFHPIRLYLFSSFLYFFFFFAFNNFEKKIDEAGPITAKSNHAIQDSAETGALNSVPSDSALLNPNAPQQEASGNRILQEDVNSQKPKYALSVTPEVDSMMRRKVTKEAYLEAQNALPRAERDNFAERAITAKILEINLKGEYGIKEFFKNVLESFLHNLPKMMFFLLPVFALILKLLYIKHKEYYYVDHAILSLHYFSFIFLIFTLADFTLDKIFGTAVFGKIAFAWSVIYLLVAMKRIYRQKWSKTIGKFLLLGMLFFTTVLLVLFANLAISTLSA